MELWIEKVIAIVVTFSIPFFFTMLPCAIHGYIASKGETGKRIICYLMCFGGGIFFGTFLLHMGPEVRGILDKLLWIPNGIVYPVTDLVIGMGFFSVLLLEKVVMRINKRKTQRKQRRLEENCLVYQELLKISKKCEEVNSELNGKDNRVALNVKKPKVCHNCKEKKPCIGLTPGNGHRPVDSVAIVVVCDDKHNNNNNNIRLDDVTAVAIRKIDTDSEMTEFRETGEDQRNEKHDHSDYRMNPEYDNATQDGDSTSMSSCSSESSDDSHAGHEQSHHEMRSLVLVMALSLHHIFEGLSIGLQPTGTLLWTLVFAVMCHESIISFSVGLNFTKCKYTLKRHFVTGLLVCLIMPIGEAIGTAMSSVGSESVALDIASGFLQAFSAGTFLFVTFFEIFQEEIDPHDTSLGKIASAFIGYIVMALLMMIPEGSPVTDTTTDPTAVTETVTSMMTSLFVTSTGL